METGLVDPKLSVGMYCAPAGLDVTAAESTTLPSKPPEGVTVIVDVFPVVAPRVTDTAAAVILKSEAGAMVTVTVPVPEALP
jgi:hypothetical protein